VLKVPRVLRSSCSLQLAGQGPVAGTAGSVVRELRTAPGPGCRSNNLLLNSMPSIILPEPTGYGFALPLTLGAKSIHV